MSANTGGSPEMPKAAVEQPTLPTMGPTPAEAAAMEAQKVQARGLGEQAGTSVAGGDVSGGINALTGGRPPAPTEESDVVAGAANTPLWPENVMAETLAPATNMEEKGREAETANTERAEEVGEAPQTSLSPESAAAASEEREQKGAGREVVPAVPGAGGQEQTGPGGPEPKPPQAEFGGQTAEQYLKTTFKEGYEQSSPEAQAMGIEHLEQVRQRMEENSLKPASWEEVREFAAKEAEAEKQAGAGAAQRAEEPATPPPSREPHQPPASEPAPEPSPAPRPVEPEAEAAARETAPVAPAEQAAETPAPAAGAAPTMTPPTAPEGAKAPAGLTEAQQRINTDTSPDGMERKKQYDAARQEADRLNQEATVAGGKDKLSPEKQKALEAAEKTVSRTERDAGNDLDMEAAAKLTDQAEKNARQKEIRERQVNAWQRDILEDNPEYQKAKASLSDTKNDQWRSIDAMTQADKDAAIDALKGGAKKEYQAYVEQREGVDATQREAEYAAQERLLDKRASAGEDVSVQRQQLEARRRREGADAILAVDAKYQALQRKYRSLESQMYQRYNDGKRSPEEIADIIRDWASEKRSWGELTPAEQALFGSEFTYKNYRDDRGLMNGAESSAKSKVDSKRLDKNYNPDGTKITGTPEQIRARKEKLLEGSVMEEKYHGPGRARRGFRWLNRAIDTIAGRASMEDSRKKAFGHARKLISDYGFWRGIVAPQSDQAKILRKLMLKELFAYGGKSLVRKTLLAVLLLAAYWVVLPVAIGKGLDMVKPFGGNG